MALDAIERIEYNNTMADEIDKAVRDFNAYKAKLQHCFDLVQEYIDNPDTETEHVAILVTKKAQGKTLIQNMLNGIT